MIKRRNWLGMIGLTIITFGLYGIYWFYSTATELVAATKSTANPVVWTVLLFVPFGCFFSWYWYAKAFEQFSRSKTSPVLLMLLWIFFSPGVWIIVQSELNAVAEGAQQFPAAAA
jgi:hypothetical protein